MNMGVIAAVLLLLIILACGCCLFYLWRQGKLSAIQGMFARGEKTPKPSPAPGPEPAVGKPVAPAPQAPVAPPAGKPSAPISPPTSVSDADLSGPAWQSFQATDRDLARNIETARDCLKDDRVMENKLEDTWHALRRDLRNASKRGTLDGIPGKKVVWAFALHVAAKRRVYGSQVKELAGILESNPQWASAVNSDPELKRAYQALK